MTESVAQHVEIRLVTKEKTYSVANVPYSVPSNVDDKQLNALLKSIIKSDRGSDSIKHVEFDFLINSELLRVPLIKHLDEKNLSTEEVTEVEYIVRQSAPQPDDSLPHDDWVSCIHADNRWLLCGSYDNNIYVWNIKTRKPVQTISEQHQGPVKSIVIIPNKPSESGSDVIQFASGSHDQTLRMFRVEAGGGGEVRCTHVCRGHAASVDTLALHPDSTHITSGSFDATIKLWALHDEGDSEEGEGGERATRGGSKRKKHKAEHLPPHTVTKLPKLTVSSHRQAVSALCWQDGDHLVSASWDHTIRVWDMNTAQETHMMQGSKSFLSLSYSHFTKLIVSGSVDRHIRLWDPRGGNILVQSVFSSHKKWVSAVQWANTSDHPNHNLFISASYDNLLKLWDLRCTRVPLYDLCGHDDKVLCCDWSNTNYMISGGADSHVKIFKYTAAASTAAS